MKKIMSIFMSSILIVGVLSSCTSTANATTEAIVKKSNFKFTVNPETFQLSIEKNGVKENASDGLLKRKVSNLKRSNNSVSWKYPNENVNVEIKKENTYLNVKIKSNAKNNSEFQWPNVSAESYVIPLSEGKYIPSNDRYWKQYLSNNSYLPLESFSMQFFALNKQKYSILYVIENVFNNEITFNSKDKIKFSFNHEFPKINKNKEYSFRIYVTEKDPVNIAKTYKNYIVEKGKFTTLKSKEKTNKNIAKLYGAPHMYFWDKSVISKENVKWGAFRNNTSNETISWVKELLKTKIDGGKEMLDVFEQVKTQDYVDDYQKKTIVSSLNQVLLLKDFYNLKVFKNLDKETEKLVKKGVNNLNQLELIDLNKKLLKSQMPNAFDPIENWANSNTVDLLKDINAAGIKNAWIGFDDWIQGSINPKLVEKANDMGYLIGTYDSYHSIHKPGEEKWVTAAFKDKSLYENATVTNRKGEKLEGFKGVGRKLNPTLSMPAVKERVESILNTGVKYNSWFIDCDAFGEVFDDYSPKHITTQQEDMNARLKRMAFIRDNKNMVIGSEGGNDFASQTIAFAHGIETPSFSWLDPDMNKNKDSKYYFGTYYSPNGGVPNRFSKQVPLKDLYKHIFIDQTYSLPLFKLVYNDSVITTYHWDWSTLKIKDEVGNRMLNEILYNTPPLYHIDKYEWNNYKDLIASHNKIWAPFHKKAVTKEMTDFKILSPDKLVQMSKFGKDLKVVANFSNKDFKYNTDVVKAKSLIIYDGKNKIPYMPKK